jgi:hypothetical protein
MVLTPELRQFLSLRAGHAAVLANPAVALGLGSVLNLH